MASHPAQFRRVIAHTLSADFRAATKIVPVDMAETVAGLEPKQVLVRNMWAGINASDINYTAGRYVGRRQRHVPCRVLVVAAVSAAARASMWALQGGSAHSLAVYARPDLRARYLPGVPPPLYPGFEAVGEVVKVGADVRNVSVGSPVAITGPRARPPPCASTTPALRAACASPHRQA